EKGNDLIPYPFCLVPFTARLLLSRVASPLPAVAYGGETDRRIGHRRGGNDRSSDGRPLPEPVPDGSMTPARRGRLPPSRATSFPLRRGRQLYSPPAPRAAWSPAPGTSSPVSRRRR